MVSGSMHVRDSAQADFFSGHVLSRGLWTLSDLRSAAQSTIPAAMAEAVFQL